MPYKQAKRDLVTGGRKIQVKLQYRETTAGSTMWGPWKEQEFPLNGEIGSRRYTIDQLLGYIVDKELLGQKGSDTLLALAFKRQKKLYDWFFTELLKKDIPLGTDIPLLKILVGNKGDKKGEKEMGK